jgi:GNAT superfamily N-acetyltransferase
MKQQTKQIMKSLQRAGVTTYTRKEFPKEIQFDNTCQLAYFVPKLNRDVIIIEDNKNGIDLINGIIDKLNDFQFDQIPFELSDKVGVNIIFKGGKEVLVNPKIHIRGVGQGVDLRLYTYRDGVMIHSIMVDEDKRGNGIGTEILNKLYDCSEEMGIPLYLIPIAPNTDNQSRLESWYESQGFGEVKYNIWSNY